MDRIIPRDYEKSGGKKYPALRVGDCCVWGERKAFLEEFMAELCLKDWVTVLTSTISHWLR